MTKIEEVLKFRFGDDVPDTPDALQRSDFPAKLAARRSHRDFKPDPVDPQLVRLREEVFTEFNLAHTREQYYHI